MQFSSITVLAALSLVGGLMAILAVCAVLVAIVSWGVTIGALTNGTVLGMADVVLEDGMKLYFAGDTSLFGDMRLIGEMEKPDIAFLPIGDRFTMAPLAAARACEWLGIRQVVPMHWGTFPRLTGTPDELKSLLARSTVQVLALKPGETAQ